ncbi:hypothetical protein [Rhizobium sp. Root1220]|uniref:hypothetical protein n=1 Tax=Rhizobium sp. Root1220 TaxID=1736432 RepID=UPI000B2FAA25|nr:hypothetical protein [Rhizobium sp. Root1220]
MAIVVALADRLSRTQRYKDRKPVEAQILLFTGVRYERLAESSKRPSVRRASRVKNK